MRVANEEEEETELKEMFEKSARNNKSTSQQMPSSRTGAAKSYDLSDDEDVSGVNGTRDTDDDETSNDRTETAPAAGRGRGRGRGRGAAAGGAGGGRGSRGGGRGGGRGAKAAAAAAVAAATVTATQPSQMIKRSQILNLDDSDNDILDVEDEEDECCRGRKFDLCELKFAF